MTRRLTIAVLALAAVACGKQTFLAAAFVQTPQLPNPQDASKPIAPFQLLTAYFGTIDISNPTHLDASKEAPIIDAASPPLCTGCGTIAWHHVSTGGTDVDEDRILAVPASSSTAGAYILSSKDEPRLTFEVSQPYTLVLQTAGADGEAFGARFVPAPATDIVEFKDSHCIIVNGLLTTDTPRCKTTTQAELATTPLTITRTDTAPAGGSLLPAFVLVGSIDPNNPSAAPQVAYTTVPSAAADLLKYVLSDADYRKPSFLIPSTAFKSPGYYIVSLLVVKQGKVSGNAFIGSIALAATGAAGVLNVQ